MNDARPISHGFIDGNPSDNPRAFLQWKGTDVCMDFYCDCGAHCHFDGYFAYVVECPHCHQKYEMPCYLFPRKVNDKTYPGHIESAKMMAHDEDHENRNGDPIPVE
jgi:hypothetical protein